MQTGTGRPIITSRTQAVLFSCSCGAPVGQGCSCIRPDRPAVCRICGGYMADLRQQATQVLALPRSLCRILSHCSRVAGAHVSYHRLADAAESLPL